MKRVILFALAIASASCGDLTRQGTASSFLIVSSLQAASGATPDEFGGTLGSDVITVNRYRVRYVRADGRNTPGVDVPYGFDGAFTVTVGTGDASAGFTLVRSQAKLEAPLLALRHNLMVISVIAEVTFFGRDQTGRDVQATANILINFANHGDPE